MGRALNLAYFLASLSTLVWLLRDDPHTRLLPVLSAMLAAIYGMAILSMLLKPDGFDMKGAQPLCPGAHRAIRRMAMLLPIPFLVYGFAYCQAVNMAGMTSLTNWIYVPIARIEKSCFGKHRCDAFIASVYPWLTDGIWKSQYVGNTEESRAFKRTAEKLERIYFGR